MTRVGALATAVMCAVLIAGCGIPGRDRAHTSIGADPAVLREAFNAGAGRVRVVALVSPTCGVCLRGAADLQDRVFGKISDDRLRGYIVWVPILRAEESNVPEATHTIPDDRAAHFWDGHSVLVRGYDTVLDLGTDAWDVYLVYGPEARWDAALPPRPAFWMHQLGSAKNPAVNGPFLDARVFADHVRALLARPVALPQPSS
jgi:hypothetical protein